MNDNKHFKYVDVDGVRTRYFEKGSGAPLVLIHGGVIGTGASLDIFAENLHVLAETFHVFAPDKLGHGETANPKADADYTIGCMTEHIDRFIATLGLENIFLIGQSRGAFNGMVLCLDHPDLIRAFVLCNSASMTPGVPAEPAFYKKIHTEAPFESGTREWVRYRTEKMCYSPACVSEEWVDEWYRVLHLPKSEAASEKMKTLGSSLFEPDVDSAKKKVFERIEAGAFRTPTLMHWGKDDPTAPFNPMGLSVFDLLSANHPEVSMYVENQAGHFAFREKHEAFNRLVKNFFKAHG